MNLSIVEFVPDTEPWSIIAYCIRINSLIKTANTYKVVYTNIHVFMSLLLEFNSFERSLKIYTCSILISKYLPQRSVAARGQERSLPSPFFWGTNTEAIAQREQQIKNSTKPQRNSSTVLLAAHPPALTGLWGFRTDTTPAGVPRRRRRGRAWAGPRAAAAICWRTIVDLSRLEETLKVVKIVESQNHFSRKRSSGSSSLITT